MEFFINQNSTLPILKMDVVFDGRTDAYKEFYSILDNANIRFSMTLESNGAEKISMQPAYLVEKDKTSAESTQEYYIYYKWKTKDTNRPGKYKGEFSITLDNGELIVPIRENLYINIIAKTFHLEN